MNCQCLETVRAVPAAELFCAQLHSMCACREGLTAVAAPQLLGGVTAAISSRPAHDGKPLNLRKDSIKVQRNHLPNASFITETVSLCRQHTSHTHAMLTTVQSQIHCYYNSYYSTLQLSNILQFATQTCLFLQMPLLSKRQVESFWHPCVACLGWT